VPSGGVDDGETLIEALHREVSEETGLTVETVGDYLGHFDYRSGSGRATRQFNFTATVTDGTVKLTEHERIPLERNGRSERDTKRDR
jgi:8-oxo-dGTP diphosphatase